MGFPITHLPPPVTAKQNEELKEIIRDIMALEPMLLLPWRDNEGANMPKITIDGYEKVKEIGLTGKYEKYSWAYWKPDYDVFGGGWRKGSYVLDAESIAIDVIRDYNDGVINGGELMGILTLIGLSIDEDLIGSVCEEGEE